MQMVGEMMKEGPGGLKVEGRRMHVGIPVYGASAEATDSHPR